MVQYAGSERMRLILFLTPPLSLSMLLWLGRRGTELTTPQPVAYRVVAMRFDRSMYSVRHIFG